MVGLRRRPQGGRRLCATFPKGLLIFPEGSPAMAAPSTYAKSAITALSKVMNITPGDVDFVDGAAVIDQAIRHAVDARRRRFRQELKQAEETAHGRVVRLLATSPAVIYSFKATGDFAPTFVSSSITRVLGYAADEYLQDPSFWRDRVHPDDLPGVDEAISRFFERGFHTIEYRFRRKDGAYCWVSDTQQLIRNDAGEPIEVVGSWSDITERKQAEEAALAAQKRIEHLLATSPAVIYSFKATDDYAPTFVSSSITRVLGYAADEYLQDPSFWRDRVHPDDLPGVDEAISRFFERGFHTIEYRFRRKDGAYCWV